MRGRRTGHQRRVSAVPQDWELEETVPICLTKPTASGTFLPQPVICSTNSFSRGSKWQDRSTPELCSKITILFHYCQMFIKTQNTHPNPCTTFTFLTPLMPQDSSWEKGVQNSQCQPQSLCPRKYHLPLSRCSLAHSLSLAALSDFMTWHSFVR